MSDDEMFILFVSIVLSAIFWGTWYFRLIKATPLGATPQRRAPLYITPVACLVLLLMVLRSVSSHDVRDSFTYTMFYTVMGLAWIGLFRIVSSVLGVSFSLDALERRNQASQLTLCGIFTAAILCFAGGNIGDGPGWWVVIFSVLLSSAGLILLWAVAQWFTVVSDAIAIDHDLASAIRLGAYLVALALILGRAVAGDWVSVPATVDDFIQIAWPTPMLTVLFILTHYGLKPSAMQPRPDPVLTGWVPAIGFMMIAGLYVWSVGWW